MTNTTDKTQQDNDSKKKKKKKKKGPIRTEAIIPIVIVITLFAFYFRYYFDSHLRKGVAYAATQAHGAEVNVGGLRTNFLEPSISIYGIQVTDKGAPEFNIVQVGKIRLKLLWDGLLRGKFVIPESSILEIQTNAKRKRPGRILPKKEQSKAKGEIEKAAEKTITQLEKKSSKAKKKSGKRKLMSFLMKVRSSSLLKKLRNLKSTRVIRRRFSSLLRKSMLSIKKPAPNIKPLMLPRKPSMPIWRNTKTSTRLLKKWFKTTSMEYLRN